jgi:hypothetical protein
MNADAGEGFAEGEPGESPESGPPAPDIPYLAGNKGRATGRVPRDRVLRLRPEPPKRRLGHPVSPASRKGRLQIGADALRG